MADLPAANLPSDGQLTDLRIALRRNGYRPVPVAGAHIAMKSAGKRPLMKAWETVCAAADEEEIARWARAQRNCTNTGLLCGDIVGIDIDVPVEDLAAKVEVAAREILGASPLQRIGRAPKSLLVFRPDLPFDKLQTPEMVLPDGTVTRVEVLATGQQFVAFGIHPDTKAEYQWPLKSPLEVPVQDVPSISREQCETLLAHAERLLRQAGARSQVERKQSERYGRKLAGLGTQQATSRELVLEALAHVGNDDLPYDEWIRIGFALYHGLGDAGRDVWEDWSAQSSKNDPAATAAKWPSFAQARNITVATLFWLAGQNGWRQRRQRHSEAVNPNVGEDQEQKPSGRPTIRIRAGQLPTVVDQGEQALMKAGLPLYQRGSMIVRPSMTKVLIADGGKTPAQRLVHVKSHHIAEAMTLAAHWERFDGRLGEWVSTDCTLRIADTYQAREGMWKLPVLTGIINCPTLRPDGSILDRPGYDAATGTLFDPQDARFPSITPEPDREEALRALAYLRALIDTFPFVGDGDRSVALSGILTTAIRRSIPTAPLHAFNAPVAGSGKSLLVDIASMIASGRPAAVIAQGKTEEEMEKRLGAALIAGDALISIDNCEIPLGGELLCQALTQTTLKVRILGKSLNAEVPSNAAMFATGNNLTLAGDMTRRAIRCSLDPGVERPELREFDRDPIATVHRARGDYAIAALTILRAYHVAGRPQQATPLGSFVEWSRWVRDALIWLGEADPCATMEQIRDADPKLEALTMVIEQWQAVLGQRRVSVKEVIDAAVEQRHASFAGRPEFIHPDFREALLVVAGDGGAINGRRLGKWLSANQNRIIDGMKIMADGVLTGIMRWRLAIDQSASAWKMRGETYQDFPMVDTVSA
ncbi:MAG: PriCT-2 domain-containing protein [Geminicoccaceae bacterium]